MITQEEARRLRELISLYSKANIEFSNKELCLTEETVKLVVEAMDKLHQLDDFIDGLTEQEKKSEQPAAQTAGVPELSDEEVVKVLASLGIDTYPSKCGFRALQVSATSLPMIHAIVKAYLAAAPQPVAEQAGEDPKGALLGWAIERWTDEVAYRPLINVHRRTLDAVWRQVIRYAGGDDVALIGPRHDDLVTAAEKNSAVQAKGGDK